MPAIPWLEPSDPFPPLEQALAHPSGLLAAGADLSSGRLLDAYRRGIFPWFNEGEPILWWSPDPRMVLEVSALHVSRSLQRMLDKSRWTVTSDRAFEQVVQGCAAPRRGAGSGTWITRDMADAYARLAREGHAHSVEVWDAERLVGGIYGVAIGRMFFGESMFSLMSGASKVALVALVTQLERWNFDLLDCQMATSYLASFGAHEIPRAVFARRLAHLVSLPDVPAPWCLDPDALRRREPGYNGSST